MDTPDNPESPLERLERLLAQEPERQREHQRILDELDRSLERTWRLRARWDYLDTLERGEDGFDAY